MIGFQADGWGLVNENHRKLIARPWSGNVGGICCLRRGQPVVRLERYAYAEYHPGEGDIQFIIIVASDLVVHPAIADAA